MTVPSEYVYASRQFEQFLLAARDALGHTTTHQTYATIFAVLRVFRRHVSLADALAFADVLPPVLRAIFVAQWDPSAPIRPFGDPVALAAEVKAVRIDHNLAPDDAIPVTARVLAAHVDLQAYRRTLAGLPEPARAYWRFED